jgi:hypothetical protein
LEFHLEGKGTSSTPNPLDDDDDDDDNDDDDENDDDDDYDDDGGGGCYDGDLFVTSFLYFCAYKGHPQ